MIIWVDGTCGSIFIFAFSSQNSYKDAYFFADQTPPSENGLTVQVVVNKSVLLGSSCFHIPFFGQRLNILRHPKKGM
jgi:hypothetical protein